jgi:hypothetical protein
VLRHGKAWDDARSCPRFRPSSIACRTPAARSCALSTASVGVELGICEQMRSLSLLPVGERRESISCNFRSPDSRVQVRTERFVQFPCSSNSYSQSAAICTCSAASRCLTHVGLCCFLICESREVAPDSRQDCETRTLLLAARAKHTELPCSTLRFGLKICRVHRIAGSIYSVRSRAVCSCIPGVLKFVLVITTAASRDGKQSTLLPPFPLMKNAG